MSWAKLDDHANEHRKQLSAGPEASWLWACGLMYANRQKARDGFIHEVAVPGLYAPLAAKAKRLAAKLVEVVLWEKVPGGYQIHDFKVWNKPAEVVEREKAEARERMRVVRANRRRTVQDGSAEQEERFGDGSGSTPTPTPTPTEIQPEDGSQDLSGQSPPGAPAPSSAPGNSSKETPIPSDFQLHSAAVAELVQKTGFSEAVIRAAEQEFRDYWLIGPGAEKPKANWQWKCRQDILEKHKLGKLQTIAAHMPAEDPLDSVAAERNRRRLATAEADRKAEHARALAEFDARGGVTPGNLAKLIGGIGG
ncbi:MAG: hypothetical protein H0U56_15555 [Methylibium sp.]|nr:hypothetical protein [Methylibium sp.]